MENEDSPLNILCVVHGCNNGPFLFVYNEVLGPDHELTEAECKKMSNETQEPGVWFLEIKSSLRQILNGSDITYPVRVYCRTGGHNSSHSYINVQSTQQGIADVTGSPTNSGETGCSTSSKDVFNTSLSQEVNFSRTVMLSSKSTLFMSLIIIKLVSRFFLS